MEAFLDDSNKKSSSRIQNCLSRGNSKWYAKLVFADHCNFYLHLNVTMNLFCRTLKHYSLLIIILFMRVSATETPMSLATEKLGFQMARSSSLTPRLYPLETLMLITVWIWLSQFSFLTLKQGEVAINRRTDVKSYTSLHTLVHDMFPPTSLANDTTTLTSLVEKVLHQQTRSSSH